MALTKSPQKKASYDSLYEIPLQIESVDPATDSFTGKHIGTGEEMTVRLSSVDEYASFYINRRPDQTPEDRKAAAQKATQNRKGAKKMDAAEGAVINFERPRRKENGEIIASWGKFITADNDGKAALTGLMAIDVRPDDEKGFKQRPVTMILNNQVNAATADNVTSILDNQTIGDAKLVAPVGVLVMIESDAGQTAASIIKPFNLEAGMSLEDILSKTTPYNYDAAEGYVALAAMNNIDFDVIDVKGAIMNSRNVDESNVESEVELLRGLYDSVGSGEYKVAIAPVVTDIKPAKFCLDEIMESEFEDNRKTPMSNRGFNYATIGLWRNVGKDGVEYNADVVNPTFHEFIKPISEDNPPRTMSAVARTLIANAEEKGIHVTKQLDAGVEQEQSFEQEYDNELGSSAP